MQEIYPAKEGFLRCEILIVSYRIIDSWSISSDGIILLVRGPHKQKGAEQVSDGQDNKENSVD